MSIELHGMALVAVVAAVTVLIRFLPFLAFGGGRPTPGSSSTWPGCALRHYGYAGGLLPAGHGLTRPHPRPCPELIAAAAVVGLHCWKKNTY